MTRYNFDFTRKAAETSKAHDRRKREGYFKKYCRGVGIDIGCGLDPVDPGRGIEVYMFDQVWGQGDAHELANVRSNAFDFVHASHILEHMERPREALSNWWRVLKPKGYLLINVPERDLYEKKRALPSRWNGDHKRFYLLEFSEPPCTVGLLPWLGQVLAAQGDGVNYRVLSARTLMENIDSPPHIHSGGEYSIEVVVKKLK